MDLPSGVRARKVGAPAEKLYLQSNKAIKVVSRKQSSSTSQVRVDSIADDERDDAYRARISGVRPHQTMVAGATRPSFNDGTRREDGTQRARMIDPPRQRMQFRKTISAHPPAFAHHQDSRARTKGTSYFPSSSRQSAWSDGPSYSSRDQREVTLAFEASRDPTSRQTIDPARNPKLSEFSRRMANNVTKSLPTIDPVTRSILDEPVEPELSARKGQYDQDREWLDPRRRTFIPSGKGASRPRWDDIEDDEEPALAAKNLTASLYHGIPLVGGPVIYLNHNASAVVIRDGKVYGKAARKLHYKEQISNQTARKKAGSVNDRAVTDIEDSSPPPDDGRHIPSRPESPFGQLKDALKALTLSTSIHKRAKRLPFLRRNMRRGFDQSCVSRGVPTNPQAPPQKHVKVIYKKPPGSELDGDDDDEDDHDHELEIADWYCPVCAVYGRFPTREMLQRHMEWDHDEVETEWELGSDKSWTISLVIHRANSDDHTSSQTASPSRSPSPQGLFQTDLDTTETQGLLVSESIHRTDSPETSASISTTQQTPAPQFKFKFQPPSTFSAAGSMRASSISSQSSHLLPIQRQRSSSPPAALVLGSDTDPLGPATRAPLFPAKPENGNSLYYSCRPGGGKLYDLVGMLPMEPYGVLSWSVIHKEEELFEADDVRDEDKVMQALWDRWILLNRNTFVEDSCKWVKGFVDEYWGMIQLAAGWRALRNHLLVLAQSKFLTGKEATVVLQHYEGLAGAK